jgi:AcrR family transcriptional regulator
MSQTPEPVVDLRSATRDANRDQIAETAFSVFAERGFEDVTVDEVAKSAGISRASFFRYFRTKEEAVLAAYEHMGAEIAANVAARPAGENAWAALRAAFDAAMPNYHANRVRSLARLQLTRETPSLRAHQLERQALWAETIGAALAPRIGGKPGDVAVEALTGAAIAALDAALERWGVSNGELDLPTLLDEAFDVIAGPTPTLS